MQWFLNDERSFGLQRQYRMIMVKSEKSNKFPIIVNHCDENKIAEFEFEKPDFSKTI